MLRYTPLVCLRRSSSCRVYSHSNLLRGGDSMTLCKYPLPQSVGYHAKTGFVDFSLNTNRNAYCPQTMISLVNSVGQHLRFGLSTRNHSLSIKLSIPAREKHPRVSWNLRGVGGTAAGLCLSFSVSGMACAEVPIEENNDSTESRTTHGKKVCTDYSVTGIPGDGRCLFRSVAHGACVRSGKPIPNEDLQRKLADELRAMVADEFVKRRADTEWFIEGDFDTYVSQIRKSHVWGGEPELLMASHVLQMPITVYMHDEEAGGLIAIAEYGQEYGKEDPVRVLYHGFGHYDALQIPGRRDLKSRL